MKAALITGTQDVVLRDIPDAIRMCTDEALIRISYVGLCGSDLELYHGTSKYLRAGQTTYPHHFGHEWVGTIEKPPQDPSAGHLTPGAIVTGSTMLSCQTALPANLVTRTFASASERSACTTTQALRQGYSICRHLR